MFAGAVEGAVNRGVEGEVPAAEFLVNDGADFPGPGIGGEVTLLIANFGGEAKPDRPFPRLRNRHTRPNMVADPHPAAVGLDGGEDVKSGFKPAGETVGDLEGFVHGVIGRKDTVDYGFCAFDGEVAVNFDHGVARGDEVRAVDLDFGVVLGTSGRE